MTINLLPQSHRQSHVAVQLPAGMHNHRQLVEALAGYVFDASVHSH
jgi:hypothetical protein